ncbi:response regulator transcription factor [Cloacibacillus sp. An23]|uniref:response regulator transcription factor n=1 Tax=Cloacibacillus sp. An23 TaxID=1965591 RepID=UPI000B3AEF75|nr:response regulator transcription factor [Cloacibacillus sp. An23]OUO94885.1 hypothetical protein B5F39_03210 [Cloacibacillus sp. An23]
MKKIEIILADAESLFTDALRAALGAEEDFSVKTTDGSGSAALRAAFERDPDAVVIHRLTPDAETIHTLREVKRKKKEMRALLIVSEPTADLLSLAGENAGIGVMSIMSDMTELVSALRSLTRGERYISKKVLAAAGGRGCAERLNDPLCEITPREREVLYWLAHGLTNKEISKKMILSEKTIKNHVSHILKKLELTDRTKAAALAWREGLPQISEDFYSLSSAEPMLK